MTPPVLERVIRRSGLALRLTDLGSGAPVRDGIVATAWPSARPDLVVTRSVVTAGGIAGFATLPGLRHYEDGSTSRDAWFASPIVHPPQPFIVRIHHRTDLYLPVLAEFAAPRPTPAAVALPPGPAAATASGSMVVTAQVETPDGSPAQWAVLRVTVDGFTTGGVTDRRGIVTLGIPRVAPPTDVGTPAGGPTWTATITVGYRPAAWVAAAGAEPDDPPLISSIFAQPNAQIGTGSPPEMSIEQDLTMSGTNTIASLPTTTASVLTVQPVP